MKRVFIDGQAGTTGLKLRGRLALRRDVRLIEIDPGKRKDAAERARLLNSADAAFLCLPDDAAREAVAMVENPNTVILDASTAHRVAPGWVYGFPELSAAAREKVAASRRIAVPGCYATGFISLVAPLVFKGWISQDAPLSCFGLSGYSGAGAKVIEQYESPGRDASLECSRPYALGQAHKHLPEMAAVVGLARPPVFSPVICDYFAGMVVSVPLHASQFARSVTVDALYEFFRSYYGGARFVRVERPPESGFLTPKPYEGTNDLVIFVTGNDDRITLSSVFDNLGKGASGAAMQCMNLALGFAEDEGFQ